MPRESPKKRRSKRSQAVGPPDRPTAHGERLMFRQKARGPLQLFQALGGSKRLQHEERLKEMEEKHGEVFPTIPRRKKTRIT